MTDRASRQGDGPVLVSVVAPVYNERAGVLEFYRRTKDVLAALPSRYDHELVLVDDGSSDDSWQILVGLAAQDPHVSVHRLSRNFGHQLALTAGTALARGDVVVFLDSDLQDPPELIPAMLEQWRDGWDVVYGRRRSRAGESRLKLASARGFYRFVNRLSEVDLPVDTGDFRLMDRQVVDVLVAMPEENRYLRGMVAWAGFRQNALEYDRDPRHAGETHYTVRKMVKLAVDATVSFSDWPLTVATKLGFLAAASAAAFIVVLVALKLLDPSSALPGYVSLMVVVLFLGGVQLLSIGLLGQYVARIYREVKQRPLYVVAESVGGTAGPAPRVG